MKFDTQHKLNMLTMNILIGIDDLDPNYKFTKFGPTIEMCSNFYEIWHLEQIEHPNYEYSTWNWWPWPKIIDSGKFVPNTAICSDFYEIWHSHIEHAYYEYYTHQYLQRSHDYKLKMIIGSEHGTIILLYIINYYCRP